MTAPSPLPDDPEPHPSVEAAQWLSALADGEKEALPHAQAHWRDDAGARERWHTYHLIGDVMRSEDLASPPGRDASFLLALRTRLAAEPVPLAPSPLMPPVSRRLGWRAPAAVAAGFVAVAATLVLVRPEGFGPDGSPKMAAPGVVIRDPQLDAYLAAHRLVDGGAAAALPGGLIRPVELVSPVMPAPSAGTMPAMTTRSGAASQPASPTR